MPEPDAAVDELERLIAVSVRDTATEMRRLIAVVLKTAVTGLLLAGALLFFGTILLASPDTGGEWPVVGKLGILGGLATAVVGACCWIAAVTSVAPTSPQSGWDR